MIIIAEQRDGKSSRCRKIGVALVVFGLLLVQFFAPVLERNRIVKSVQVAESAPVSQEESNSELQLEEMTATPNSRYRRPLHRRENKRFARRHLFTSKLLTVDTQSRHDPTMVRRNGCGAWLRC